jgi:hypothetical protein
MCTAVAGVLRRNSILIESLAFALQVLIAVSVEVGDDLARRVVAQHGTIEGINNAREVVAFEAAHGFWIEPGWQLFFEQSHRVLALTVTWADVAHSMNFVYIVGHVFVTLGVAFWVYFYRRPYFALLRNVVILTNVFALCLYERFPVAPPRLTTGLIFDHHAFAFQDTMYGILFNGGRVGSTPLAYNEFSAMPSLHVAWALVVGAALLLLARPFPIRLLGVVYPTLMLMAVVVTGNHYLLDAIGAALCVMLASILAVAFEGWRGRLPWLSVSGHGAISAH